MKKYLLILIISLPCTYLYAQQAEYAVNAYSGLFRYVGPQTVNSTALLSPFQGSGNDYGIYNGFSYGLAIQSQYVYKSGIILGFGAGYEILRSTTHVTEYNAIYINGSYTTSANYTTPANDAATGNTHLQDASINLNPYFGYRFKFKKLKFDIMPGFDFGINTSSYIKGSAITTADGVNHQTSVKQDTNPLDIRGRLGVAATYNRVGLIASYAWGFSNYISNYSGNNYVNVQSRLARFGVTYLIH